MEIQPGIREDITLRSRKDNYMKIVMLTGSPHKSGTTSVLADSFCDGVLESGSSVERFDTAALDINPCTGCGYCRSNEGKCIHADDMEMIYKQLVEADVVVLASPLYYFGFTAQLKSAIDRFYAVNPLLRERCRDLYIISAGADQEEWAMDAIRSHAETMCRYLRWKNCGEVMALGCASVTDLKDTDYEHKARRLGEKAGRAHDDK